MLFFLDVKNIFLKKKINLGKIYTFTMLNFLIQEQAIFLNFFKSFIFSQLHCKVVFN